jgi:sodium/hydrogen antiporter
VEFQEFSGPSVLALALLAFVVAMLIDANGFVAAFVAGSAFGAVTAREGKRRSITLSRPAAWHR